jgi:nucleotide-binding universal stress UspA family protein
MNMINVDRPIVVGVDGSPGALNAVRFAAILADRLERPLALVNAYRGAPVVDPLFPPQGATGRLGVTAVAYAPYSAGVSDQVFRMAGERALAAARAIVEKEHPGVSVGVDAVRGAPAKVLANASRFALMVVVGRSGGTPIEHVLTGSTVSALLAHATAPAVVVPPDWSSANAPQQIVVGVEGAQSEAAALQFAFGMASQTGASLDLLHANRFLEFAHGDFPTLEEEAALITEADHRIMAESLAGWREVYPDVVAKTDYSMDGPATALIERSKQASLLVVGARARGGLPRLRLGSTARAVALHAACPVAVVRPATPSDSRDSRASAELGVGTGPMY